MPLCRLSNSTSMALRYCALGSKCFLSDNSVTVWKKVKGIILLEMCATKNKCTDVFQCLFQCVHMQND